MSEVLASVESLYRGISGKPVSPALAERVNIVHSALSGLPAPRVRTVAAPVYVTDLGVRNFIKLTLKLLARKLWQRMLW